MSSAKAPLLNERGQSAAFDSRLHAASTSLAEIRNSHKGKPVEGELINFVGWKWLRSFDYLFYAERNQEMPMIDRGQAAPASVADVEWPERLRAAVKGAVRGCGYSAAEWVRLGFEVHHVVAAALPGAEVGRRVLSRWSISVHSVANAAIVPKQFHRATGLHRLDFLHAINQRLLAADMFAEGLATHGGFNAGRLIILETLRQIGKELVFQSGDSVADRLQSALHGQVEGADMREGTAAGVRLRQVGRAPGRRQRERCYAATDGAGLENAALRGSRRSCLQRASACS